MNNQLTKAERVHLGRVKELLCSVPGCERKHLARGFCQNHYMQQRRAGSDAVKPRHGESDTEYIKRRVLIVPSGCWEWQGAIFFGYGKLVKRGQAWQAHAFSFVAHGGCIPPGMQVNHKCHNRLCCNPEHLYAGTQAQNMADMRAAGRQRILNGSANGMAKLDIATARAIFESVGIARLIAERHQVSVSLVYAIRKKKIWRHIHE